MDVATPKSFVVDLSDIDGESTRNALGDLIRDRIAVKRKLSCDWEPLRMDQISALLQAVQNEFFQVTYPDPMTGSMRTSFFYVGDRTAPMYWQAPDGSYLWKGLSMNLVEQ